MAAHVSSPLIRTADLLRRLVRLRQRVKLILICGPWGSGTTSVAGMMARLGAQGFGPYYPTDDPRTPVSYEFTPFRETVLRLASERNLALKPGAAKEARTSLLRLHRRIVQQEFGLYDRRGIVPIFFKYPLSALLIPQICAIFDTRLIYVIRPLEDIERTRARREWSAQFGRTGAEVIYRVMHTFEQLQSHPILTVTFTELLQAPAEHAHELARFADLEPVPTSFKDAIAFVRAEVKAEPSLVEARNAVR